MMETSKQQSNYSINQKYYNYQIQVMKYWLITYLFIFNAISYLSNASSPPTQSPSIQKLSNKQIPIPLNSVKHLTNRPIERPNLMRDNVGGVGRNSTKLQDPLDTPGDWFMMDGDDLLPQEGKSIASIQDPSISSTSSKVSRRSGNSTKQKRKNSSNHSNNRTFFDDDSATAESSSDGTNEITDEVEEGTSQAGSSKEPECASHGRYYCTFKEDYPLKLVTEVTKYYKWPLEKLFRDLHAQIMPKLAQDSTGNLVCDSITRVVRPGWARNTNERWLVVINTENYHQYVTEVVCQYGSNSRCNFIPPCYYSSCQQRYNTQKLLVIDPSNPYRGPFLSEFLFPSCCVCYVPSASDSFQDKYRSSPATIYQRTMQQESANNLYPPQFKPAGLIEETQASLVASSEHGSSPARMQSNNGPPVSSQVAANGVSSGNNQKDSSIQVSSTTNQAAGPGEIRRRAGEPFRQHSKSNLDLVMDNFPRLGLTDSLDATNNHSPAVSGSTSGAVQQ